VNIWYDSSMALLFYVHCKDMYMYSLSNSDTGSGGKVSGVGGRL
jgi:hypothetical protein